MGYAAIYPEDVISHHRGFIARRRTERPSEEYRDLAPHEWDEFARNNPDLLVWKNGILSRYYGEETLKSELARNVFVFPDRQER